eukprot:6066898-Lingulodinium_polyedra.AAC.1
MFTVHNPPTKQIVAQIVALTRATNHLHHRPHFPLRGIARQAIHSLHLGWFGRLARSPGSFGAGA